jgi:hypothetical protein
VTDDPIGSVDTIYVPVQHHGHHYRAVQDFAVDDEPEMQSSLRLLVEARCTREVRQVELSGRMYTTTVYVSRLDPSNGYVEATRDGVPVDAPPSSIVPAAPRLYWRWVLERLRMSDALVPEAQAALDEWFIPPRFEVLDPDHAGVEWSWLQAKDSARLVVLGEAGAGKTSCLRRFALDAADDENAANPTIPVYIQMRDFPLEDLTLSGIARIIANSQSVELERTFRSRASVGHFLLLFDGLDEVVDVGDRTLALTRIAELCSELPDVRVVVSSRQSDYLALAPPGAGELPGFRHVRLMPFTDSQVAEWMLQYVSRIGSPEHWRFFVALLREDPEVAQLLRNPMLLSLASVMFVRESSPPTDHAALIGRCVEALLRDWDAARGINRWSALRMNTRHITVGLSEISAQLCRSSRTVFSVDDVNMWATDYVGMRAPTLVFLAACETAGLVSPVDDNSWRFTHRLFQDYLAARHLVDSTSDISNFFSDHLKQSYRERTWRVSCGLASDAGDLLEIALRESSLTPLYRATLLAEVLGQDLTARRLVVQECCQAVVLGLEDALDGFRNRLVSGSSRGATAGAIVRVETRITPEAAVRAALKNLLRLVWRAMQASAGELLTRQLESSKVESVRALMPLLKHSGHWSVEDENKDDGYALTLFVDDDIVPPRGAAR